MKKRIMTLLGGLMLSMAVMAQLPAGRTVATTVADALAQLPARDPATGNAILRDLAQTGEEGILQLASRLNPPGGGSQAAVEYALSGIANFVSGSADETLRATVANALIKALKATDDPTNRQFIISLLQTVGRDETVDALAPLLASPEPQVSDAACRAVAAIRSPRAATALKTALMRRQGTTENLRSIVVAIGEARTEGAEELLIALLPTDNAELRRDILHTLSRVGGDAAGKILADAAAAAGYGYEKTGATDAFVAFLKRQPASAAVHKSASALLAAATKAGQKAARIAAIELIIDNRPSDGLKTVLAALKDPCPEYRTAALNTFSPYATDKDVATIAATIAKASPAVKADVINWTGRMAAQPDRRTTLATLAVGKTTLIQTLEDRLSDTDTDVRRAAAAAIVAFHDTRSTPALVRLLSDSDPEVIEIGRSALSATRGDVAAHAADRLHTMTDTGKIAALSLIAGRRANDCLKNVLLLIQQGSPEVKTAALTTLKDIVRPADAETLAALALQADERDIPFYQQAGIAALGRRIALNALGRRLAAALAVREAREQAAARRADDRHGLAGLGAAALPGRGHDVALEDVRLAVPCDIVLLRRAGHRVHARERAAAPHAGLVRRYARDVRRAARAARRLREPVGDVERLGRARVERERGL